MHNITNYMVSTNISRYKNFHALHFLNFVHWPTHCGTWFTRVCVLCICLLCVCTNDIDVQVCVIVRNRNSVRGRALRSKGGSNKIDTSALDSPLPVPLLFFPLSFITCPFPSFPFFYFLHSPSNDDYEPQEDSCWEKKLTLLCHSSIKISISVLVTLRCFTLVFLSLSLSLALPSAARISIPHFSPADSYNIRQATKNEKILTEFRQLGR